MELQVVAPLPLIPVGTRFGRLITTSLPFTPEGKKYKRVSVVCDCGVEKEVGTDNLRAGCTTSCGCVYKESRRTIGKTHGLSKTAAYGQWHGMVDRCTRPASTSYKNYGGRGIKVCSEWLSYGGFLKDMGLPPFPRASLDRIDVNGNYCKENVRWVTHKQQMRNMRKTLWLDFEGRRCTLSEVSEITKIPYQTLWCRHLKGWVGQQLVKGRKDK